MRLDAILLQRWFVACCNNTAAPNFREKQSQRPVMVVIVMHIAIATPFPDIEELPRALVFQQRQLFKEIKLVPPEPCKPLIIWRTLGLWRWHCDNKQQHTRHTETVTDTSTSLSQSPTHTYLSSLSSPHQRHDFTTIFIFILIVIMGYPCQWHVMQCHSGHHDHHHTPILLIIIFIAILILMITITILTWPEACS